MKLYTYTPSPLLQPYIEMYWLQSGYLEQIEVITLIPDNGGINLILNLGENIKSRQYNKIIDNEGIFLVGTYLHADEQELHGDISLFGIKFKPGAFTHFYQFDSLHLYANQFQEFHSKLFPDIKKTMQHFIPYINQYYLDRLKAPKFSLLNIVADITQNTAQRMETLAKKYFTTERYLERQFKQQIGISPKEFINLQRFNQALKKLQQSKQKPKLSDIAWDCGYYDHAHLTNDFKKYTGKPPTELILSDFSKSGT